MNSETLKSILEIARCAPSADNCQPWYFRYDGQSLGIYHDTFRAEHPLNSKNIASNVAFGCLSFYISEAAKIYGYEAKIEMFDSQPKEKWAQAHFIKTEVKSDFTIEALIGRHTDRRSFTKKDSLLTDYLRCQEIVNRHGVEITLVEKPSEKLFRYMIQSELVIWQSHSVLKGLFQWLRFSKKEIEGTCDGMPVGTLGVNKLDGLALRMMRPFLKWIPHLLPFGFRFNLQAKTNKLLKSSSAFLLFSLDVVSDASLHRLGESVCEIWVYLNSKGWAIQPMNLSTLAAYSAQENLAPEDVPTGTKNLLKNGKGLILEEFGVKRPLQPLWLFRVGKISTKLRSDQYCLRLPIQKLYKVL